ncbi:MAG: glyoxalase [Candidatus Eremiobacteraeota bacterium]|nr:glyoxalase [Candidatus Eremiobacteraeota bacterium]
MRYRDARSAIEWLSRAFGFDEHLVVPGQGDSIAHAELKFAASILMLGSGRDDELQTKTPRELDGTYTQTLNVYVSDPDAHCARAKGAGAEILEPPSDTSYGTKGYVVRDPEGYVWNFNTYRPRENTAGERARASKGVHIAASFGKPLSF